MMNAMELQHPDISVEKRRQIDEVIAAYRGKPGSVITVLRLCQGVVGYLPMELMDHIGRGLNLPPSDVYGVASFYSLFSLTPKGRHTIKVCMGTACYVKGIKEVNERISDAFKIREGDTSEDRRFTMEAVRCLGACGLAPVMVVDQDIYGHMTSDRTVDILKQYK